MLRISRIDGKDARRTLKLEGKLLAPWIAELRAACDSSNGQLTRTNLDLSGLTFVDQAGADLLKDLIRGGCAVPACSGFVAELLHLEKS